MTVTLGQVRDRLRAVDSNGMSGDVCDELADAIDALMVGMGKPVAWLAADGSGRVIDVKAKVAGNRAIATASAVAVYSIPLYAAPPYNLAAVREVIADIRRCAGNNNADFHRSWANKLEAAMPKEAK